MGVPTAPARRLGEAHVLVAALGLLAVYVLDDNFARPQPGTDAADHLVSGLVPLALLGALALALPRLPRGGRAAVALTCGPLALTAGVADRAATALLAGAVLTAGGALALWRGRRRGRSWAPRAAIGVAALVFAYLVVLPAGLAIVVTHRPRAAVAAADLGRPRLDVSLRTRDGLRLAGWYVPSRNRAAVLAFPGRRGPVPQARMLVRHGYGVLLLDPRGEGASEGDYNARGWGGEPDVAAAVAYLRRRPDVDPRRVGGLGLSVGGELLLEAAAREPGLRAVVSEGAGRRSLAEQLEWPGLPRWQRWTSPMLVETGADAVLSDHAPPPDLAALVPRIAPRPVLLIRALHGNADEVLNRVYYAAARPPKTLWEVPRGGHTGALAAAPREYERRVIGFFDQSILRR